MALKCYREKGFIERWALETLSATRGTMSGFLCYLPLLICLPVCFTLLHYFVGESYYVAGLETSHYKNMELGMILNFFGSFESFWSEVHQFSDWTHACGSRRVWFFFSFSSQVPPSCQSEPMHVLFVVLIFNLHGLHWQPIKSPCETN